jgi:polysaccharide biosynthesis protein PslH
MRVLALTSWWPEPADNGIKLRLNRLLRSLAHSHELHLAALCHTPPDADQTLAALGYCASAEATPAPELRRGDATRLGSLLSSRPASVRATWSDEFAALVRRRAAKVRPDVVLAFELSAAPYALLVPGAPRLLDDLEMATLYDAFAESSGRRRLRRWLTWARHRAYVRQVLQGFAGYTVVSPREAALARALAPVGIPTLVVPNGADVPAALPAARPEPDTLICNPPAHYRPGHRRPDRSPAHARGR